MLVRTYDNAYDLQNLFMTRNRDYYTIDGYNAIIDYFAEFDEPVELDVVAICCDFTESDPDDIIDDYSNLIEKEDYTDEDGEIDVDKLLDFLNYHTYATLLNNGNILYINF